MRRLAGLAIVLSTGAAFQALAQPAPSPASARLAAAAFSAPSAETSGAVQLLDQRYSPAASPAPRDWASGEAQLAVGQRTVDTLHITMSAPPSAAGRPLRLAGFSPEEQAYDEVRVVRDWPAAVSITKGSIGLDVSPHAGVGVSTYGGLAEAGAVVQVSRSRDDAAVARLKALGLRDGATLGQQGRWYLFAAASGRAVGLNMMRSETGWDRGWTTDATSTLVGDAQVGIGWRKGAMQTSLGYVHREIKGLHTFYGVESKADEVVAFSFTVRPRR